MIKIEGKQYKINDDEYTKIVHQEYNNLKLYNELGIHERIIGFIKRCATIKTNIYVNNDKNIFYSINTTHGGFIPINLSNDFENIYIIQTHETHLNNINFNIREINNKTNNSANHPIIVCKYNYEIIEEHYGLNIIFDNRMITDVSFHKYTYKNSWLLINKIKYINCNSPYKTYKLFDSKYFVHVSENILNPFKQKFNLYIDNSDHEIPVINYDNLINLCIMVKNAGPQFEEMLIKNISNIDTWTILDTGSTDETIDIINKILVGKKEGQLYQEPFINFRDSRNRLLELAGGTCKYNLMLDDTYIIQGDLRSFLTEIRSDQYGNSFTLFIHSDDTKYGSNRITKSNSGLRYIHTIHEVITDKGNINIVIPENRAIIFDGRFDYMEKRTLERKQLDLKLLYQEIEDDPNDPRAYYYLAQTYNILEDYEKAFFYFIKRSEFVNSGFIQERIDALFEAARIANFKLNRHWEECEQLYLSAFKIDESRPESLYFIGVHYYLEGDMDKAYEYFKRGFNIGFPQHCQYSLKPTLSYHFLPKFLTRVCYNVKDYDLGEKAAQFFLFNNGIKSEDYEEILSWYKIMKNLNVYKGPKIPVVANKPIFCFVADGGFSPWSGRNILTSGVGGSETYIIELARYIKQFTDNEVYVFCNTPDEKDDIFEGVIYRHISKYHEFINTNYVKNCIISRFSEYLPLTFNGFSENVYFVIHDLTPSGIVIPKDLKLKKIFCLTEWHVEYFTNIFPSLKDITVPFYYGIDDKFKANIGCDTIQLKIKNKFIYSSYPNRGLLQLLQMWPIIYEKERTSTLYIYSDVDNKWSNDVEPEKMALIRNLLAIYNTKENGLGIYYKGWVSKKELSESWLTSDIWFYPCTFQETFCLTALEAASSNTLCVTNDLAALQNTVGDRGVIIKGDATTEEWQRQALEKIFYYMDEKNTVEKQNIINRNYDWAKNLSWKNQATRLLEEYINPNNVFEYKGMYSWTHDLPSGSKTIFLNVIEYFVNNYLKVKFAKRIDVLEIGTYTGTSLIEIIKLIPNSYGIAVDKWTSYNENDMLSVMDNYKIKDSFYNNVKNAGLYNRITGIQTDSMTCLLEFIKDKKRFDFIYVDGSHLLLDTYADLILAWQILEKGGILAIDDYLYNVNDKNILNSPYKAIGHFLDIFKGQYKTLHIGYRVFIEKN